MSSSLPRGGQPPPSTVAPSVMDALRRSLGAEAAYEVLAESSKAPAGTRPGGRRAPREPVVPVVRIVTADILRSWSEQEARTWVGHAVGTNAAVAVEATSPAERDPATTGPPTWGPAEWGRLFAEHGWRFADVIRPALWQDPTVPLGGREGWSAFLAPEFRPELAGTAPTAVLHPDRLAQVGGETPRDLELIRVELNGAVRQLAHRRELDALRHYVEDGFDAFDMQQVQHRAAVARLAATERRVLWLMEQSLRVGQSAAEVPALPAPRGWRRRLLGARGGGSEPATPASSPWQKVSPAVLVLFEAAEYVAANPEAKDDPLEHYLRLGEPLGHRPNPWFDPLYYLEHHPDVRAAGMSALVHFAEHGVDEARRPSEEFDLGWYVSTYPEVRASGLNPLVHFMVVGQALGYQPVPPGGPGQSQAKRR